MEGAEYFEYRRDRVGDGRYCLKGAWMVLSRREKYAVKRIK